MKTSVLKTSQPIKIIAKSLILAILSGLCGCDQSSRADESEILTVPSVKVSHSRSFVKQNHVIKEQRVQKFIKQFTKAQKSIHRISSDASPHIDYITKQLKKRNMPGELALLPMIESNFKPQATSNRGAAGIWQFMPSTGRMFGLKQKKGYDGRRDIKASTDAALDYLESLHKEFNNNWMLALAAYNAGPGTVRKAIKRNQRAGKSIHFFDLQLPKQTKEYVPKFLALVEVMGNPGKYAFFLPEVDKLPIEKSKKFKYTIQKQ